jgi:hypothetical protein
MITVNRRLLYGQFVNDVRCLSTDRKPTEDIKNGSTCLEIDTGKRYAFDAENSEWHELPTGGGGGGVDISGLTSDDMSDVIAGL